jgi:hypothetical protein
MSVKLIPWDLHKKRLQQQQADSSRQASHSRRYHSQTCLQTLFFFFFSLPLMREQLNYTCKLKNLLKLYCIWTWDTWWGFVCVCVCVCVCVVLFYFMCPLWWDNYRTTSEAPSPGLETEMDTQIIKTETSLHLNLEVFFFNFLFSILF